MNKESFIRGVGAIGGGEREGLGGGEGGGCQGL